MGMDPCGEILTLFHRDSLAVDLAVTSLLGTKRERIIGNFSKVDKEILKLLLIRFTRLFMYESPSELLPGSTMSKFKQGLRKQSCS